MGIKFSQLPIATEVASNDYVAMLDTSEEELKRIAINHASTTDAFGLGTATAYGHNKIIDDLSKTSFTNGEALSAHQGNILANDLGYVESNSTAVHAHAVGEYFIFQGQFVKCTAAISISDTIALGTNVAATDVGSVLSTLDSSVSSATADISSLQSSVAKCECVVFSRTGITGLPVSYMDSRFDTDMVCIHAVLSNPSAQLDDWTVNTDTAGRCVISGSISGSTDITLYLMKSR